ncbi:MAG: hypothetical protein K6G33_13955 [Ruminococcus sp.]|uniref:hypothetical protein n=1 Tax=Ruminococcus sp. TaxID=41978 RepID=UPI0025F61D53|nr:hypothetical protein [Ruminococcus sp.]MCR5601831.1 hypothetical protein [Ruminococcus sp.]
MKELEDYIKEIDGIQDICGLIITLIVLICFNVFLFKMLWFGFRSIFNKTLNLPPSRRKWFRTRADVVQNEDTELYQTRYYYDNVEYSAEIDGFTVYGNKAMIYVSRKDPTVVKEFIPKPALSKEAAFSCIFIASLIILIESMLFFG